MNKLSHFIDIIIIFSTNCQALSLFLSKNEKAFSGAKGGGHWFFSRNMAQFGC